LPEARNPKPFSLLGGLLQGDLAFLWPVSLGLGLALPVATWIALPLVPAADTAVRLTGAVLLLSASLLDAARIWRPSVEHIPRAITTLVMLAGAIVSLSLPWPDGVIPLPNLVAVVLTPLALVAALGYAIIYNRRKARQIAEATALARQKPDEWCQALALEQVVMALTRAQQGEQALALRIGRLRTQEEAPCETCSTIAPAHKDVYRQCR
jgi:hypothetical protein